jgi:hypothetical protein
MWAVSAMLQPLSPDKSLVHIVWEARWASELIWRARKILSSPELDH